MKPAKSKAFRPGDLVKISLPEGKSNILCFIVPTTDYYAYSPDTQLKRIYAGTVGLFLGSGPHTPGSPVYRDVLLVEEKFVSILAGNIKKIGAVK